MFVNVYVSVNQNVRTSIPTDRANDKSATRPILVPRERMQSPTNIIAGSAGEITAQVSSVSASIVSL